MFLTSRQDGINMRAEMKKDKEEMLVRMDKMQQQIDMKFAIPTVLSVVALFAPAIMQMLQSFMK